jgi:UDP-N-acetyl-alpha-D-quinovosamine dehydrogenase
MTVLVTGGTGFIGRVLVERLAASHGAKAVVCLVKADRHPDHDAAVERFRQLGVRVMEGDLTDPAVSSESAPAVDVVFHLAANIDTAAPLRDLRVNDRGTANLLDWLAPVLPGVRVMYTSSVAALDRRGPSPGPLDESSPCAPRTMYGLTKLRGERIIESRASRGAFTYTILRLGTVYGPGCKPGGLFDRLITLAVTGSPLGRLNWPGRVSVIHVDDVADLLMSLSTHHKAANEVYCVANPEAPTVGQLAERVARACGRQHRALALPPWAWTLVRRVTWFPALQAIASLVAARDYWRFSLLIDNVFWLDTRKLQLIWTEAPVELDAGLTELVTSLINVATRL